MENRASVGDRERTQALLEGSQLNPGTHGTRRRRGIAVSTDPVVGIELEACFRSVLARRVTRITKRQRDSR